MREFIKLIMKIDSTTKTRLKVEEIIKYLESSASNKDKMWAIYFLLGEKLSIEKLKRSHLKQIFCEVHGISDEFYIENRSYVGDSAEAMALLTDGGSKTPSYTLTSFVEKTLLNLDKEKLTSKRKLQEFWEKYNVDSLFVIHKMITGGMRIGLSKNLLVRALSQHSNVHEDILHQRLISGLDPLKMSLDELISEGDNKEIASMPYPFYLASPTINPKETFKNTNEWIAEWKWDGIRLQIVKREDEVFLWSRGGELINESFPDIVDKFMQIKESFVLDGELLIVKEDEVQDFNSLQTRLRRKKVTKKLAEELPANVMVYDLLEVDRKDLRELPLGARLSKLEELAKTVPLLISQKLTFKNFKELEFYRDSAREMKAEGLMVKRLDSTYKRGRKVGDWWKWKVDPYSLDLILTYAQAGSGRRSGLHTDYTFGIWNEDKKEIVTLTKAYSGLTDKELETFDRWIRSNTIERYGPVRRVTPKKVFEVHFEGISPSKRHNSGLALRFPRIHRVRDDKSLEEANTLSDAEKLLEL